MKSIHFPPPRRAREYPTPDPTRAAVIAELNALESVLLESDVPGASTLSGLLAERIAAIGQGQDVRSLSRHDLEDIFDGAREPRAPADRLSLFFELRGEVAKLNEYARDAMRSTSDLEENVNPLARTARRVASLAQRLADAQLIAPAGADPGAEREESGSTRKAATA